MTGHLFMKAAKITDLKIIDTVSIHEENKGNSCE
jgi:hypothetical protein